VRVWRADHPEEPWTDPQVVFGHLPAPRLGADAGLLLTPEEAAQVLRVGRTTIYALMTDVRCLMFPSDTAPTPAGKVGPARSARRRINATRRS
jgi:predicted DNA-binding transcriptional regulator AlpA